jgi:hypothetical protein
MSQRAVAAGAPPAPAPAAVKVGTLDAITELFTVAKQKLKYPALTLALADGQEVRFSIAGGRSSCPGSVVVKAPGAFGSAAYWGRIMPDGNFQPSRQTAPTGLQELMEKFAANPVATVAEYGKLTGRCCFCSLPLEHDDSTDVGYGPICARNWKLPYGKKAKVQFGGIVVPTGTNVKVSTLTEAELRRQFVQLSIDLSPENLSCDGELPAKEVKARRAAIMQRWGELERAIGRTVTLDQAYSWTFGGE